MGFLVNVGLLACAHHKLVLTRTAIQTRTYQKTTDVRGRCQSLFHSRCQEFYMIFGGNILLCQQAIDKLLEQFELGAEDSFDPFSVRGTDGLAGLAKDPLTREHLENLARQGWSPIEEGSADGETESQKGARIIAKKNFGGVINRETTTFLDQDLKDDMFSNRSTTQVLIPATSYLRNCIKVYVEACEPSSLEAMC